ncbi:DUF58 domain-containing protein [Haematomicrobium sanguinis]|uniref:DUF58 domain-containing protein n=1 Tax=Haematomicrobium sanguinis TaxID=479106 RepID=UPI00068A8F5A|nr:DUF58 domain-containing protein [Haematomicrobium sanguinis]
MGFSLLAVGILALAFGAIMGRRDLLYVAVFAIALLVLSILTAWVTKPRFRTHRTFSVPQVQAGQACTVQLEVSTEKGTTARHTMREELPSRFGQAPTFLYPSRYASADGTSLYEYRVRCSQRGLYSIGPVSAMFTDPFGLAKHQHTVGQPSTLVVTPPIKSLSSFADVAGGNLDGVLHTLLHATASQDDVMTREYRHGDSLRRVHWPATARLGELMVRQEDTVTTPQAVLVMDRRDGALASAFDTAFDTHIADNGLYTSSRFEWVVTMAASIAAQLLRDNYQVRMVDQRGEFSTAWDSASPLLRTQTGAASSASLSAEQELAALLTQLAGVELVHTGNPAANRADAQRRKTKQPASAVPGNGAGEKTRDFGDTFLDTLAGVRGRGPLIALLGDLSARDVTSLAAAANYYPQSLAILCVQNTAYAEETAQRLRSAGWQTVVATEAKGQPEVWNALSNPDSISASFTASHPEAVPSR